MKPYTLEPTRKIESSSSDDDFKSPPRKRKPETIKVSESSEDEAGPSGVEQDSVFVQCDSPVVTLSDELSAANEGHFEFETQREQLESIAGETEPIVFTPSSDEQVTVKSVKTPSDQQNSQDQMQRSQSQKQSSQMTKRKRRMKRKSTPERVSHPNPSDEDDMDLTPELDPRYRVEWKPRLGIALMGEGIKYRLAAEANKRIAEEKEKMKKKKSKKEESKRKSSQSPITTSKLKRKRSAKLQAVPSSPTTSALSSNKSVHEHQQPLSLKPDVKGHSDVVKRDEIPGPSRAMQYAPASMTQSSASKTKELIEKLLDDLKPPAHADLSVHSHDLIERKLHRAFESVSFLPDKIQVKLQEEILEVRARITVTEKVWSSIAMLLEKLSPDYAASLGSEDGEIKSEMDASKVSKLITKFEDNFKKYYDWLRELDTQVSNWDTEDEENSSFVQQENLRLKLKKIFDEFCDELKIEPNTRRPIQSEFSLSKFDAGSGFIDIDKAVEEFVNGMDCMDVPNYLDILQVVTRTLKNVRLKISDQAEKELVEGLFTRTVKILQVKRAKDFNDFMRSFIPSGQVPGGDGGEGLGDQDPAKSDPILEEKLMTNKEKRVTPEKFISDFTVVAGDVESDPETDVDLEF